MIFLFENFAESRLVIQLSMTADTIVLPPSDAAKWPKPQTDQQRASAVLYDGVQSPEIVWVVTNPGTGTITVERGMEGTSAKVWRAGTVAINTPTKVSLSYLSSGGSDSWHQELVDMVNEAYARISEEYTLRLTSEEAFAQRLSTVEAGYQDSNAAVQVLSQAFADINSAWANYQVDVTAQVGDAVAKAGQALNTSVENGEATAELRTFVETAVGDNAASFAEKITAFTNFDTAQVIKNEEFNTRVGDTESSLTEEIILRSTQYETQAEVNFSLDSRVGENTAAISTETETRASETSALAIRASNIEVELGDARGGQPTVSARINSVESASAAADSALATRAFNLEAEVGTSPTTGLKGRIGTEESVRAAADGILAGRANTIEAQLAGTENSALLGRIVAEEGVRLAADSVLAGRASTIEGQLAGTLASGINTTLTGRIAAEEIVRLNADGALATRATTLETRAITFPNLIEDGDFNSPLGVNWYLEGGAGPSLQYDVQIGSYLHSDSQYVVSKEYPCAAGTTFSVSWNGTSTTPSANVYIQALPSYALLARAYRSVNYWGTRHVSDGSSLPAPAGTTGFRVVVDPFGATLDLSRIKVNYGNAATDWSNERTLRQTVARITTEETVRASAIASLATRTSTVEAQVRVGPNLIPNSTGAQDMRGWTTGGPVTIFSQPYAADGARFICVPGYQPTRISFRAVSAVFGVDGNSRYSLQGEMISNGHVLGPVRIIAEYRNAANATLTYQVIYVYGDRTDTGWFKVKSENFISPATATKCLIIIDAEEATFTASGLVGWRRLKLENGEICTGWADDKTAIETYARVQTSESAIANAGGLDAWWQVQAIAGSALAGIRAKANSTGGSQIGMIADSIALFNTVLGVAQEVFTASGGNIFIKNNLSLGALGEILLVPSLPAIIWTIGSAKLVIGKLPNDSMILWFGPSMSYTAMTKSNATIWADTNGNAYFGGSIIAGALSNSRQGTDTSVGASTSVGPFATLGHAITVAWSYTFTRSGRQTAGSPLPANPSATIRLYRTIGTGGEVLVDTMSVTGGSTAVENGPSDWFVSEQMSGSSTFTDTVGGLDARTYRIEVYARTTGSRPGSTIGTTNVSQRYSIVTSEN